DQYWGCKLSDKLFVYRGSSTADVRSVDLTPSVPSPPPPAGVSTLNGEGDKGGEVKSTVSPS
ncbi:MAG: hypothetical protein AMJ89_06885, partial [candidate division Zixibacteria bacterium SM23_73]